MKISGGGKPYLPTKKAQRGSGETRVQLPQRVVSRIPNGERAGGCAMRAHSPSPYILMPPRVLSLSHAPLPKKSLASTPFNGTCAILAQGSIRPFWTLEATGSGHRLADHGSVRGRHEPPQTSLLRRSHHNTAWDPTGLTSMQTMAPTASADVGREGSGGQTLSNGSSPPASGIESTSARGGHT